MLQKIRYRLTWNRSGRLNRRGDGLIQIECQQQQRRVYFSTHVYVRPGQFDGGMVVGLPTAEPLNYALYTMVRDVEQVELEYIKRGVRVTLPMLKEAVLSKVSPGAKLSDFGREVVEHSDRKKMTRNNYRTLLNNLERFFHGALVTDVDYQFVCRYDRWLQEQGVAQNTRVSRLRLLRALMAEARRRDLVGSNPFDRFKMQQMVSKKGFLTTKQVHQLERMTLTGREELVRDGFLLAIYTGLRFSDIVSLREEHLQDGWIVKPMVKTGFTVEIPYTELFDGRAARLISRYGIVERLTRRLGTNATVNQTLHAILSRIGADKRLTFHSARHTFATLLGQRGVDMQTIQQLLGHQKIQTTKIYNEASQTQRKAIERGLKRK